MLVDEIINATWRLRRARRAESGEITLSVDTGSHERENENPVFRELLQPASPYDEGLVPRLQKSAIGCEYIMDCYDVNLESRSTTMLVVPTHLHGIRPNLSHEWDRESRI